MGSLMQLTGEGSDQEIATEAHWRFGAMQSAPSQPQIVSRLIHQFGNFDFDLGQARLSCLVVPIAASSANGRRPARALASRSVVDRGFHALAGSAMR
jgi:hypothetical protein